MIGEEAKLLKAKLVTFLEERGLSISPTKSLMLKWIDGAKLDFLGFRFHMINRPHLSPITRQVNTHGALRYRGGLYIYPSPESITSFKYKVKLIFKNINASPYKVIRLLNPLLRGWANYFCVGTLSTLSKLDHYVFYRSWRYLARKFPNTAKRILVQRYYQGIKAPSNRTWHFHGLWFNKGAERRKAHIDMISHNVFT